MFFVIDLFIFPVWKILRARKFHFLLYKKSFFQKKYKKVFILGAKKFHFLKYKKKKFLEQFFAFFKQVKFRFPRSPIYNYSQKHSITIKHFTTFRAIASAINFQSILNSSVVKSLTYS